MPWTVGRKTPKGWEIVRADTGQVVGYSSTREKAAASVRARYANSPEFHRRRWRSSWRALLALLAVSICLGSGPAFAKSITVEEADTLTKDPETWILDVRTVAEWKNGHLGRSHVIPVQELSARASELPSDLNAPVLLYCRSGRRSTQAYEWLKSKGYRNLYTLEGGVIAWTAAGKPVEKAKDDREGHNHGHGGGP